MHLLQEKKAREITNDLSGLIVNVLKERISSLENELKSKDAIIEYLTKQLLSLNSKKSPMKNDKCNHFMTINRQTNQIWIKIKQWNKRKGWLLQEIMLNGILEKGMSKNYRVKVNNFPAGTSATILENIDQLVKIKSDCLIVHDCSCLD